MAAKTEAQIPNEPPQYDPEVAKAIHEFLNPQPEPILTIEKSESAFMKVEREKKEAAARKAAQKPRVQVAVQVVTQVNGDCWAVAEQMTISQFGATQWPAMRDLIRRESNCNPNARNPSSGACGVPQALPCSKLTDRSLEGQIRWMLNYVAARYGTPSGAIAFHNSHNWY